MINLILMWTFFFFKSFPHFLLCVCFHGLFIQYLVLRAARPYLVAVLESCRLHEHAHNNGWHSRGILRLHTEAIITEISPSLKVGGEDESGK